MKRGDVCYGMLRAAACVDESHHHALEVPGPPGLKKQKKSLFVTSFCSAFILSAAGRTTGHQTHQVPKAPHPLNKKMGFVFLMSGS